MIEARVIAVGTRITIAIAFFAAAGSVNSQTLETHDQTDRSANEAFVRLADRWDHTPTTEQDFNALTQLAELEPKLDVWTLTTPRLEFRATVFEYLGDYYQKRTAGTRADNLEQSIFSYQTAIAAYSSPNFADRRAKLQYKLGRSYGDRPLGDHADNLEMAIAALEHSLDDLSRARFPNEWAQAQYYLANAFSDRRRGVRSDNYERAIRAYRDALGVWTLETQPESWAKAHANLAAAYRNRLIGIPAENVDEALRSYQDAAGVFTREAYPQYWGWTQIDLADTYLARSTGERDKNIEEAIKHYDSARIAFSRELSLENWARIQRGLARAYSERNSGDPTNNIEQAIGAVEAAITAYDRKNGSAEFANAQKQLADLYLRRIAGDPAANVDKAIRSFDDAMSVYAHDSSPWAELQFQRGMSFLQRTQGDRADNLELAIGSFQAALRIWTRETYPQKWAETQGELGVCFRHRIRGDAAQNLESAIASYESALVAVPPNTKDWAAIQNNLAIAYQRRILGSRTDNLELAIKHYESALTIFSATTAPEEWAHAKSNLANIYLLRIRGEKLVNLKAAEINYGEALTVFRHETFPLDWAGVMTNLGIAAQLAPEGNGRDIEASLRAFRSALTVYTRDAYPEQWAATQDRIGSAIDKRTQGNRDSNRANAIAAYENALSIRTRDAFPREWAATQHNLAILLARRQQDIPRAIAAYQEALTVYTIEALPRDHLRTSYYMGQLFLRLGNWEMARRSYEGARKAFLLLFGEGLDEVESRDLIDQIGVMFSEYAYATVSLGDRVAALDLLNEGKAQQMAVSLRQQALHLPPEKSVRYSAIKNEIRALVRRLDSARGLEGIQTQERLSALRLELVGLLPEWFDRNRKNSDALTLVRELIPARGAIVAPIVTRRGGTILIVRETNGQGVVTSLELPDLTTDRLNRLLRGDKSAGLDGWIAAYNVQYLPAAEQLTNIRKWRDAIENIGSTVWELFAGRLDAELRRLGVMPGASLIWLPPSALGLLPLGLARDPADGRYFADTYEISYAANLEALKSASDLLASAPKPSLIVVSNPTGDIEKLNLPFAEIEGALVKAHFSGKPSVQLDKNDATRAAVLAAVKDKTYWHFSSHGFFDWEDARRSGLRMKGEEPLTVSDLLDTEGTSRPRLVVLSACETGLYDTKQRPEEFVGLPTAFMQLGAAGVLSSLWEVDDLATAFLMAKFYDFHLDQNLAPADALRKAQAWLRNATRADLLQFGQTAAANAKVDSAKLAELRTSLKSRRRLGTRGSFWNMLGQLSKSIQQKFQTRPFSHPYFWAGFIYAGL
jgi:CHAT domain-containing protein